MKQMTPAAVERAMKLQDVMLRAMAKRITWYQAAEILGLSGRQMLRWQTRFKHEGMKDCLTAAWCALTEASSVGDGRDSAAAVPGAVL